MSFRVENPYCYELKILKPQVQRLKKTARVTLEKLELRLDAKLKSSITIGQLILFNGISITIGFLMSKFYILNAI